MDQPLLVNSFLSEINKEFSLKNIISNKVHIRTQQRTQQRTSKKYITIIESLPKDLNFKKIIKQMKKKFVCNRTILKNDYNEKIINLSGDQRYKVKEFLINYKISDDKDIIIHGF